jgi:hypothetical protein
MKITTIYYYAPYYIFIKTNTFATHNKPGIVISFFSMYICMQLNKYKEIASLQKLTSKHRTFH